MSKTPLNLTRNQISEIVGGNPRAIRAIEDLMFAVNDLLPAELIAIRALIQEVLVGAGIADTKAGQANDSIERIAQALELIASAPAKEEFIPRDDFDFSSNCQASEIEELKKRIEAIESAKPIPHLGTMAPMDKNFMDFIGFNQNAGVSVQQGQLAWNSADGCLDIGMGYDSVVLQAGLEMVYRIKADSAITNGQLISYTGAVGSSGVLRGAPSPTGLTEGQYVMGVATMDITANGFGYVTSFGLVRGIDTTGSAVGETWADGDILYYNPSYTGALSKNIPTVPLAHVIVASVINAGPAGSGSLFIRPTYMPKVNQLSDVYSPDPHDLDLLQYNTANARWESNQVAWVDIDFPIIVRTTGVGIPTLTTVNGNITMPQWAVNDFNICECQELIHSWKEGSQIYWHLHLTTNGTEAVTKYVRFELEYGYVDAMGVWVFPAVVTTADIAIPANTPDNTMMPIVLANFTPAIKIGAHVVARLKRVASVGAAPAADPWIPMLQMHVQLNTIGSRNISSK